MTTYFITGGFGFLGQYIVKAIHEHDPGAELRVLVRTKRKTLLGVETMERVRLIYGELLEPESYETELQGVDTVIHNAALVSFRKSDADAIYESNVIGTRNLAQATLAANCKNFIFISSISAIGFNPNRITDESMMPDMEYKREHDMYGYSKRISEIELLKLTDKLRVIMLNPSVVLGPGSERIGAVYRMASYLPILPMLSYINSFVDVRDVAQAVVLSLTKGRSGERYIVTAHNGEMLAFVKKTLKATGRNPLLFPVTGAGVRLLDAILWIMDLLKLNPGIRRPSEMAVDKILTWEKIRREMGWEPQYTLEQSIADSVKMD
ncbi:MAG: NAD-dependent epimerase/dehydratase family protein [Anaerolineales bacterium]|nr:NAD-dependent epimerase/dehydratase family protein [Anaerolineales bacterium]